MSVELQVAIIGGLALILSGVLVEMVRTRRSTARTEAAVSAPGDSAVGVLVRETRDLVGAQGTRLAVVERLVEDHLKVPHHSLNGRHR